MNPFYPNEPIPPNLFVGRAREVGTIKRALKQTIGGRPESVLVVGARGSGKTSLVQYASAYDETGALQDEEFGGKVVSVLIRCGGMSTLGEFCAAAIDRVKESLQARAQLWNMAKGLFEELEIDTGYIKLRAKDPSTNPTTEFVRVLRKLWSDKLSRQYGALQLIADETDDLNSVQEFPGFVKNVIESLKERPLANVQVVVTIVDEKLAQVVRNHPSFPRVFHLINLGPLNEHEMEAVITTCLDEGSPLKTITDMAVQYLKLFTAGIPNYLHQFCHEAFEVDTDGVISDDDVFAGAHGTLELRGSFEILWDKHFRQTYAEDMRSPYKRKILHTLALLEKPSSNAEISQLYREIFREAPTKNLAVYLTNMVGDHAINRFGKRSPYLYQIADPRLSVLLRFYPGTDAHIYDRITTYVLGDVASSDES